MSARSRLRLTVVLIIVAIVAGGSILALGIGRNPPHRHGPFTTPLFGPWFGLKDNLEENTGGWFGGLYFENQTSGDIEVTAVWGVGVSDNLALGPVWRGRGRPDPVIWPEINPERLQITPLDGDAVFPAGSGPHDDSLIIRFDLTSPKAGILFGFRIDYRYEGEPYSLYLDTYHCVAPDRYYAECKSQEVPPSSWEAITDLDLTPIKFAEP